MAKSPDMRTFNAAVANNHGAYDACLVRVHKRFSNWTQTSFGDIPVAADHFIEDTRARIIKTLRQELSIPQFGTGTKSFLPTDLAFRMVRQLGARFHTQRSPLSVSTEEILVPLQQSAKTTSIILFEEDHPLGTHYRVRNERFSGGVTTKGDIEQAWKKVIDPSAEDFTAMQRLTAMNRGSFEGLLTQIQPFLTQIDETY